MRKQVFGRKFKRDRNERQALFKGLISSLVMHERIQTTEEKAKAIRSQTEKLVTKAKKQGDASRVHLQEFLNGNALAKMINDIGPRFANRNGGYTRIIKTGNRIKDNAAMAIIEWTEIVAVTTKPTEPRTKRAATKKATVTKKQATKKNETKPAVKKTGRTVKKNAK